MRLCIIFQIRVQINETDIFLFKKKLKPFQIDVNNDFLNDFIIKGVYVEKTPGS